MLGHFTPDWTGGLLNAFRFKGVDLSVLFDTKQGGELFSVTNMFGRYSGVLEETLEGREDGLLIKGVNEDGTPNSTRVSTEDYSHSLFEIHEPFIYDASFIKLRELKLGYTLPTSLANRLRASSVYASIVGRNLWLKAKVPHIDPETAFDASNAQGLEFGQLPSVRSIGFQLTFTP